MTREWLSTRLLTVGAALVMALQGCCNAPSRPGEGMQDPAPGNPAQVEAPYATVPVVLDGVLSDPVWQLARAYPLAVTWRQNALPAPLAESGTVRFAWDERYFYVAGDLEDLDIVAESDRDDQLLYGYCDLLEVFIKPEFGRYYWELYGTVNQRRTSFFNPARGRNYLPSKSIKVPGLIVRVSPRGTFNDWSDKDQGWTIEMAIPVELLTSRQDAFTDGARWRVLVGRYNHSAYHDVTGGELSSVPTIGWADFQLYTQWARLKLLPAQR